MNIYEAQKQKMEELRRVSDAKMLALKGSFFDVSKAMYKIEEMGGAGRHSAYLRQVIEMVDNFKAKVEEYISSEDAIIVAMSDPGPRPDDIIPSPAELTDENTDAWQDFPQTSEDTTGGHAASPEG